MGRAMSTHVHYQIYSKLGLLTLNGATMQPSCSMDFLRTIFSVVSLKKAINHLIQGFGITWGHTFYMDMQNGFKLSREFYDNYIYIIDYIV